MSGGWNTTLFLDSWVFGVNRREPAEAGGTRNQTTLNQRVQGSSPCAPTIEINQLEENLVGHCFPECELGWEAYGKHREGFRQTVAMLSRPPRAFARGSYFHG